MSGWTGAAEFSDPLDHLVPFPLPPEAVFQEDLSSRIETIFSGLHPEDGSSPRKVAAYTISWSRAKVEEWYSSAFPVHFRPIVHDLKEILTRVKPDSPALTHLREFEMKGVADGGLSLFEPYYDFSKERWMENTLILILR
ncbi:MAG TPA: hypothetical protein PK014_13015 [Thermoanaerobaculia bacterium]|nr:hypothetical protein [Thermoanaerobaculia bacterium]HUM31020.1 hypothetical protein [Thermoanaerobaculia bacterium]HXK69318.1 hypothetical protein [Thermoanaerobaculia bacterium]